MNKLANAQLNQLLSRAETEASGLGKARRARIVDLATGGKLTVQHACVR